MAKRSRSKNSNKSLTNTTDSLENKGSSTHQNRSGAKGKRGRKNRAQGKRAANKKTHAKRTKRTGRKAGGRKRAYHDEHSGTEAHETVANSTE